MVAERLSKSVAAVCGVAGAAFVSSDYSPLEPVSPSSFFNRTISKASAEEPVIQTSSKLRQVHIIFRHGARTPVFECPGFENISFNVCSKINQPPGTSFDSPPGLAKRGVSFVQLNVTDLEGKSPRPFSVVDKLQSEVVLKGGECRLGQLTELGALQVRSSRSVQETTFSCCLCL